MYTKKLFLLVALLVLVSTAVFGQSTTSWTGGAGNSTWNTAGNWSDGVPSSTITAIIDPASNNPELIDARACSTLVVHSGGVLNLSGVGANTSPGTLTVSGNVTIDAGGTINGGTGTLQLTGNWVKNGTFFTGSGSTIELNGTGTSVQTVDPTSFYNLLINRALTGSVSLSGTVTVGNNLNINQGTLNAGSAVINLTGPNATPFTIQAGGTFTPGTSTINFKNTVSAAIPGGSYYNLGVNRASFTFTPSAAMTVSGVLAIDAGTFVTGAVMHNIKGSFTVATGVTFTATAGSTLNFNGSSAQQIPLVQYEDIKINNAAGVSLFGATGMATVAGITIGDVTANSVFNDGGNQIYLATGANTLVMAATATLKLGSATTATTLPAFETQTLTAGTPGATIEYAATPNQSVAASAAYKNVTLSGGGIKSLAGTTTVTGTLLINTGVAATIGPAVVVTSNGTLTNNGSITLTGTGSLTVTGLVGTQAIGTLSGSGNLGFAPTGAQTVDLGSITSTGIVSFDNAANFITFVGSTSTGSTLNNLLLNSTAGGTIAPINNWTVTGTLTMAGTAALSLNSGKTLSVTNLSAAAGSVIVNAGTIALTGATVTIDGYSGAGAFTYTAPTGGGAFTFAATPIFTSTGTVTFAGATAIAFTNAPSTLKNVVVSNTLAAGVTMPGNWTLTGNLSVNTGSTLNLGSGTLTVGGSVTEAGTGKFSGSGAHLIFNGANAQTWTLAAVRDYNGITLEVAKTSGKLYVVGGNVKTGTLTFTSFAAINMGGNQITLMGGSPGYAGTVGVAGQIYNGTVAATLANAAYTFPVGNGTAYTPLILTSATSVPGLTAVSYVDSDPGGTNPSLLFTSTGPSSISVIRASAYYWTVNTGNSLAAQNDLSFSLAKTVTDPFQAYGDVRLIVRNLATDAWTGITGTYANTGGPGTNDITAVVVSAASAPGLSAGTKVIAYGLASAIVHVGGLVYYGDLARTTGNEVGSVTVSLVSSSPAITLTQLIATGASTSGYSFSNVGGITNNGYNGKVTTFPAWSGVTGTSSTDAVAVRNTIVGRTTGAITAAETMKIIAADVDNGGGTVLCSTTATSSVGGEVSFASTPSLTWINAVDVMQILQRAAGTISSFARGDFYSTDFTTPNKLLSDYSGQTIRVIAIGDASYTAGPTQLKKNQVMFATVGNMEVPDMKKAFLVPVKTTGAVEAAAFTMAFKYPSDKVDFQGVVSSLKGINAVAKDGYVRMSWIDMSAKNPATFAKDADMFSLKFQPKAGFDANTAFSLQLEEKNSSAASDNATPLSMSLSAPQVGSALPTEFAISQNYPNPFNPTTSLNYAVPELGRVSLKIYNILGEEVANLFNGVQEPGRYTTQWNAGGFASGVYIVRMTGSSATKNFSSVVKIMLLK